MCLKRLSKGCTVFDYTCLHLYLYDVACACKRFPVAIVILHVLIDFNVVLLTANSDGFFLSSHVTQKRNPAKFCYDCHCWDGYDVFPYLTLLRMEKTMHVCVWSEMSPFIFLHQHNVPFSSILVP